MSLKHTLNFHEDLNYNNSNVITQIRSYLLENDIETLRKLNRFF